MKIIMVPSHNQEYIDIAKLQPRLLKSHELDELFPYIIHLIDLSNQHYGTNFDRERFALWHHSNVDTTFTTTFTYAKRHRINAELLTTQQAETQLIKIKKLCKDYITSRITVAQYDDDGTFVCIHPILKFKVSHDVMVVQFITLGNENNFDLALSDLSNLYPEV